MRARTDTLIRSRLGKPLLDRRRLGLCLMTCMLLLGVFSLPGCIERTVSINTEPEGAKVFLNDQEVGQSPVTVPFTWYGDYDIIIRKRGFKTVQTHHKIQTPWYSLPGIDFFTECLMPFTVHDDRVLETYVLDPQQLPDKDTLLDAAESMRADAGAGDL